MQNDGDGKTAKSRSRGVPGAADDCDSFLPTRRTLLSRLRNLDDQVSWQSFFDTYWKLIYRAAIQAGLTDDEAKDVVQETVLTVVRRIQEFKYDPALGSFKGWLLHTTRWRVLDHVRCRERHPAGASSGERENEPFGAHLEQIPDPASAKLDAVWDTEWQQNLLDAAIQRVKRQVRPKHFQVFELYAVKQWPASRVAKTLNVNIAQVHLIKHRVGSLVKKEVQRLENQGI